MIELLELEPFAIARPRYCQSKLAQVLKTRGYAQEAEQLLHRVVRGGDGTTVKTGHRAVFLRNFQAYFLVIKSA